MKSVFTTFSTRTPQLYVDVDRDKAQMLKVPLEAIFEALRVYLGSAYVNDFNMFGRTFRVTAQADASFRMQPENVARIRVRNESGQMVPIGNLVTFRNVAGPDRMPRYNLYPTVEVNGSLQPGISHRPSDAGDGGLAKVELPAGVTYEWTDLSYQEAKVGNTGYYIFLLSVIFVFLTLAAQFESWSMPLAIILIVPMCLLSALFGVALHGQDINILTQIGFIVLIGLAAKNAILIVEFARQLEDKGRDTVTRGGRSLPAAPAADPDDVACLHARRRAALHRHGCRRGDAYRARHRRVLGHDRRDAVWPHLHAGVLRRDPPPFDAQAPGRRRSAGAGGVINDAG